MLSFSTVTHLFCSTCRLLGDFYSHGTRVLGHKSLPQTKELLEAQRSKIHVGAPWRCDFAAVASFNLYFSLQGDVNTAVTSCSSSAFAMLPVSDHHSWSSWKV